MILVFAKVLVGEDIRDSNSTSREMIPPSIYGQGNMLLTASVVREERSCRIWSDGGESCAGLSCLERQAVSVRLPERNNSTVIKPGKKTFWRARRQGGERRSRPILKKERIPMATSHCHRRTHHHKSPRILEQGYP